MCLEFRSQSIPQSIRSWTRFAGLERYHTRFYSQNIFECSSIFLWCFLHLCVAPSCCPLHVPLFLQEEHCVIVVEQVESLPKHFLTRLIALLYHMRFDPYISLLVCISTNTSLFASYCSLESLELLDMKIFRLVS